MEPADQSPFSSAVRSAIGRRECLGLAVVPTVLVGVFLSPEPVRRSLTFAYADPSVVTAVTAHFVHFSLDHLLANVLGYVVLTGLGYVLAGLGDCRRLFGVAAATYLLAFPPVLSALNLAVPRRAVGFGFSGINMAFAGLLPVLLAVYAGRRLDSRIRPRHAPVLFFAALTLVALSLPRSPVTVGLAAAAALGTAGYAGAAVSALRTGDRPEGGPSGNRSGWVDVFVVGVAATLGFAVAGFPAAPVRGGTVVNLYVHLLGFCLAFIGPYVGVEIGAFDVGGRQSDP
ncbi:hypothetical protein ACFR97_12485 [Haloplanus litoreus]|uniref:Rhomboid family protein n=1 Tax=Haloplanus litoreus TaxID=767515 RepID=A0ABD5ZYJ4_9EURY